MEGRESQKSVAGRSRPLQVAGEERLQVAGSKLQVGDKALLLAMSL